MKDEAACILPPQNKAHVALRLFINYALTVVVLLLIVRHLPALGRVEDYGDAAWIILIIAALSVGI